MQPQLRQIPPSLSLLDAEHALLELGGADRRRVARGAAADHHDVIVVGHGSLFESASEFVDHGSQITSRDPIGTACRL